MGLKRFLLSFLPGEVRDPIMGDLEETGFRWLDCLTAFAGAWAAHGHRELLGPIPQLAQASEDAIRRRIAQLSGPAFGWNIWVIVSAVRLWYKLLDHSILGWVSLPFLVLGALLILSSKPTLLLFPNWSLRDVYRGRLAARLFGLFWCIPLAMMLTPQIGLSILLLTAYRGSRIIREGFAMREARVTR